MAPRSVRIEADGGSRGNPGPAAYGAVLFDADTGRVIAERADTIGVATNNVAEYSGLIAGLELYRAYADGADLEVRMDSKLVVEQMSGRWKVKHPDMRPLALRANRLAPSGTTYTWIPRAENAHADRILNLALDEQRRHESGPEQGGDAEDPLVEAAEARPVPRHLQGPPTTLVLVRHGETDHTRDRKFSGRGGADPGLNEAGVEQVRATARWLHGERDRFDAVVTSPLRRTRETADLLVAELGGAVEVEDGLAEADFGAWDGLTFPEARERDPEAFDAWIGSADWPAGGTGESVDDVDRRVREARRRLLDDHAGRTVLVVSHVTPIKLLVRAALDLPLSAIHRTELAPASVTVVSWYPDGHPVVRVLNGTPHGPLSSALAF